MKLHPSSKICLYTANDFWKRDIFFSVVADSKLTILLQATLVKLTDSQNKQTKRHEAEEGLVGKRWESVGVGMGQTRVNMIKVHYVQV